MMFLVSSGGIVDFRFGILTSPGHKGIPKGIIHGMSWAIDNECYTKTFELLRFQTWLETMKPYRDTCLFVNVPDIVGNARETLQQFAKFAPDLSDWPLAFAAQDGQESLEFPKSFDALFVGGTTDWKMSSSAIECIQRAQSLGKHIHIGRVNWYRRFAYFAGLPGSEEWTCDGTRQRFEGVERTMEDWAKYMARPRQAHLFVSSGDCTR